MILSCQDNYVWHDYSGGEGVGSEGYYVWHDYSGGEEVKGTIAETTLTLYKSANLRPTNYLKHSV